MLCVCVFEWKDVAERDSILQHVEQHVAAMFLVPGLDLFHAELYNRTFTEEIGFLSIFDTQWLNRKVVCSGACG